MATLRDSKYSVSDLALMIVADSLIHAETDRHGVYERTLKRIAAYGDDELSRGSDYGRDNERANAEHRAREILADAAYEARMKQGK